MAVLRLVEEEKCVVEGAGATGMAAAFAGLLPELKGKRFVSWLILFGKFITSGLPASKNSLIFYFSSIAFLREKA